MKSAFVDQIFVYGDSLQNFLVGIVVPDRQQVKKAMEEKGRLCARNNLRNEHRRGRSVRVS